jgi:hypothetical protein
MLMTMTSSALDPTSSPKPYGLPVQGMCVHGCLEGKRDFKC